MANVSQLQPALCPQVQTSSNEASEKDADFLALRLLNKRARLRLSPAPFDVASFPSKATLFATVNSERWFAAVTRDVTGVSALILSPLADLRSALVTASAEHEQLYKPQRRVPLGASSPHILTFACNDTRLLLGLVDGAIHVYASDQLLSSGDGPVQPIHVFATSSSAILLSIQPNPEDIPELVAVLRDCTNNPGSLVVELLDVQAFVSSGGWLAGSSPNAIPTSISWSPKGKQLALGLQSGDIVTFSPSATATPKSGIPHPPSASDMSVISVHWLSTSSFYTIYAPPGQSTPDVEQVHFYASLDSKNNFAQDIRFNSPYLPFPGLRPPGGFLVCLQGWDPSKLLLFVGDSTSSDIGLIGIVADDSGERWHNLTLEETSTPSLPLDKDQNDTVLLGMDVDLTNHESYRYSTTSGEMLELPAHPIMYVYASDGTILGWHILNVTGTTYPNMMTALNTSASALSVPSVPTSIVRELSSDMQTTPTISPTMSAPAEASVVKPATTAFGAQSLAFGQTSTFDQTQTTSIFGRSTPFGQSATAQSLESTTNSPLFGRSPKPAFASTVSTGGFGAFSSTGPAKFGQPTFGFGGLPQATSTLPSSAPAPEESMAADDTPSLDSLGLGVANSQDAESKPSIFGKHSVPTSSGQDPTDNNLIRPGTGFGTFAGFDQESPFAKPSTFSDTQQSIAFGFSAFTSSTQNAFVTAALTNGPSTPNVLGRPHESPEHKTTSTAPAKATDSIFAGSNPGPSTSAFSSLQTMPSAFIKPASGVFGELPKDSPFFAPKPSESKPALAFALSSASGTLASTPSEVSSTQPTFGVSSMRPEVQGTVSNPPVFGKTSLPVFLGEQPADGGLTKPGTGFGTFTGFDQKSQSAKPFPFSSSHQPATSATFGFSAFASGAQSAFAVVASKNGPSAKPVWATSDSSKPSESRLSEVTTDAIKRITESSESTTPSATPSKTADPSVFSSSTPGPSTGAFSNLQTTPSAFARPASPIFDESHEDSPFVAPQPIDSRCVSAFTLSALPRTPTSTPPKVGSTQPLFGISSIHGTESQDNETAFASLARTPSPSTAARVSPLRDHDATSHSSSDEDTRDDAAISSVSPPQAGSPSTATQVFLRGDLSTTPPDSPVEDARDDATSSSVSPPRIPSLFSVPRVSPVRDLVTTPPCSSVKDTLLTPVQIPAPTLKVTPPPTIFPLTSRTNNRPVRSSPLASTSINLEGEGEKPSPASKSAPPVMVLQPATPRPTSGQWTPSLPLPAQPTNADSTGPVTPPVPSLFPAPGEKPASYIFPLATTPAFMTSFPPAENKATPSIFTSTAAQPAAATTFTPGASAPQFTFPSNHPLFKPSIATPSARGSSSSTPPPSKTPTPAPTPVSTPEQGMQTECLLLLESLDKEWGNLKQLSEAVSSKSTELRKTSSVVHQKADLGDPCKWVFGDIEKYGRILVDVQADVKELKLQRMSSRMKELESNMLKLNTRKEEIMRFNKAKTDAELAKMLKIRTLAPEYLETQSQLRRKIRAIRDRVQKLEDHLQASKKRINELRTGRPSIRPPSLDTVNRTFRNIDIAIGQQRQEINELRHRMARLEISRGVGTQDQLVVSSRKRPVNVAPNVAITTAAALNAERSAQKLKKAILASRAQPLLNTTVTASSVPTTYQTPQKAMMVQDVKTLDGKTLDGVLATPATPMSFPSSLLSWTPPPPPAELGSPIPHEITPTRNRGGVKHHQKPITLKKAASPVILTQPSPFEWKPVEPVKPSSSLPFALRPAGSN